MLALNDSCLVSGDLVECLAVEETSQYDRPFEIYESVKIIEAKAKAEIERLQLELAKTEAEAARLGPGLETRSDNREARFDAFRHVRLHGVPISG